MSSFGQIQQAWVAKYSNGITNGNHQTLKITLDSSGNIYVLGVSQNANTNTGYVTIKYAPNGNVIWTARYDSTNYPSATPTGFALDGSNNVIVTGNAVTVKYDSNGNQLWTAPYSAQAIAVDSAQNICITGVSSNFTTIKLSPVGSNLWTESWAPYTSTNLSQVIGSDVSNNVYVAGREGFPMGGPGGTVYTFFYFVMLKYDSNGHQLWEEENRTYSDLYDIEVHALRFDNYANAYLTADFSSPLDTRYQTFKYNSDGSSGWYAGDPTDDGFSASSALILDGRGNVIVTGANAYYYPSYCYGTYKIDTNGNYLWTNLYPTSPSGSSTATATCIDTQNSAYVTGFSSGTNLMSDIVTLKYSTGGNQLWLQRYNGTGNGNDAGNAIAVDNTGNVYVAGYETEANGSTSMVLIKYSPVVAQRQSNGNFILQAYGSPGENFDIQASTNLQTWQDLGHVIADTNGFAQFADTNASNFNARFYYTVPQ